jgi:hypothetical protein
MSSSLLLLGKFVYDIVKRLIHDAYYRSLGSALLLILLAGTLFFWLVEGSAFLYALTYSAMTMAMNSPYGFGWGPKTPGGLVFNIIYVFLSVGLFLLFVLETGKTMVQTYDEFLKKMSERRARKRAKKQAGAESSHE